MSQKTGTPKAEGPAIPGKSQAETAVAAATPTLLQRAQMTPSTLTPKDVKHLQRTIGNRATVGLLSRALPIQTQLTLGPAGDKYEQEADQVAAQVVRQIDSTPVQRQEEEEELQMKPFTPVQRQEDEEELQMKPSSPIQRQEDEEELQMKPSSPVQRQEDEEEIQMKPSSPVQRQEDEEELQMKPSLLVQRQEDEEELQMKPVAADISRLQRTPAAPIRRAFVIQREIEEKMAQGKYEHGPEGGEVEPSVTNQIQAARGGGRPLDEGVRSSMESGFSADFGKVRVHTDARADTLNRSLNARAFTVGNDIFFRGGEYNPGNSGGKQLLAHELTHTVQQGAADVQRQSADSETAQRTLTPRIQRGKTKKGKSAPAKTVEVEEDVEAEVAPAKKTADEFQTELEDKTESFTDLLIEAKSIASLESQRTKAAALKLILSAIDEMGNQIQARRQEVEEVDMTEIDMEADGWEDEMQRLTDEERTLGELFVEARKTWAGFDEDLTEFEGAIDLKAEGEAASGELSRLRGLWTSPASAKGHFNKHTGDTGYATEMEYLQKAETLTKSAAGGSILSKVRSDGDRLFFDKSNGNFAILSSGGKIRTLFHPSGGESYYKKQT